jgi:aminoglycoside 2''-phosphotransferase
MDRQNSYLECIRDAIPDLDISSAAFNGTGQNSDVLVINGELIFRFPRYAHVIGELETELAVLTAIHSRVPLDVPDPEFVCVEGREVGRTFVGYRMIPGDPLWRDTMESIRDEGALDALAAQIAGFLQALHCIPASAISRPLPVSDTYAECADIYARMREKLSAYMRPDARQWMTEHFETFLGDERNFGYDRVLKHGDFGPSNILYAAQTQRISGIIDFGGSCWGDPAYDFAGLLSGYGESFVQRCARFYPPGMSFWDRIRFYQGTFALLEALFGIENDDPEAFRDGIAIYT